MLQRASLLSLTVTLVLLAPRVTPKGAGRAFPIDSENFAIQQFQTLNSNLEWDSTNFLVDLSGRFAVCKSHQRPGLIDIERKTPDGFSIVGVYDVIDGTGTDIDKVNMYVQEVIGRWMVDRKYVEQIKAADRLGCSVRPGCSGHVVVICLFSPGTPGEKDDSNNGINTPLPTYRPVRTVPPPEALPYEQNQAQELVIGIQKSLAFTPQEYQMAESLSRKSWDRSYFLENLSGYEADCAMIYTNDWGFSHIKKVSQDAKIRITGQYGYTANLGSTPDAMTKIINQFKKVSNAQEVGCSVIPDCTNRSDGMMYVVVTCLYIEP